MEISEFGALCFGIAIGWITYRTLRRKEGAVALSDIATVIGAVGGGAVSAIVDGKQMFGFYSIGLAIGFFAYLFLGWWVYGTDKAGVWMGD